MFRSSKLAALLVATASFAPLAIPVAASAAVTPDVQGNTLTVTSTAADQIDLTVVGGKIAVNGTATALDAGANAQIIVNAGAENDTVDASALAAAGYGALTINGEAGEDKLTGGGGNDAINGGEDLDELRGGDGNDTLTGGKGNETIISGGVGDDTMIWNPAEGNDLNDGGEGTDTVLSNGAAAGETYSYKAVNDRVLFKRTGGAPEFSIDFTAERLAVNLLGGDDTIAPEGAGLAGLSLIANAGEGNDQVVGAEGKDVLNGDAGNDSLIGGKEDDTANGGDNDDTMTWNNGDGTDINTGGPGNDTVVSNGNDAVGEVYTYGPGAPGRVQFNRAPNAEGKAGFGIDLEAESLVVNSLGGNDQFSPTADGIGNRTTITVNAGAGNDMVNGGDGVDVQNGDAGSDTLVGGKGADTANGGDGDDTMIWNNGDGTDKNTGDAGTDTVVSNGNDAANEVYTYGPRSEAGRVQFNRLPNAQGAGAFGIDLSAERFIVNGLGGDDKFSPTAAGLAGRTAFTINAGAGNDTVTGGDGADDLHGDGGNDSLFSRDGVADFVHGDAGTDSAQTDALTLDKVDGVEKIDALGADKKALLPLIGKVKVTKAGKKLFAQLRLTCPAAETGGCKTRVTLKTAKAVRLGKIKRILVLGSKSVKLAPGAITTVKVPLSKRAASLAKGGKLSVKALITSTDAAGNKAKTTKKLALKLPRAKK